MHLAEDNCYAALKARDVRFDGQFFTCVKTTGIYCRPICPARTPKRTNCTFVASAAAAEDAGYRPCLRCRPESAPGSPDWLGKESVVHRALRVISESAPEELSMEHLSGSVAMSSRQLRRLFAETLGTNPKSVMQNNRIAVARQLLMDTQLPISEVAMAAGFGSIRRFNASVRSAIGMTPTALRARHGTPGNAQIPSLHLGYRPPFAWRELLSYFAARGIEGLEAVDDAYTRSVRIGDACGHIRVTNDAQRHRLRIEFLLNRRVDLTQAVSQVRDLLDLDASPQAIAAHLRTDRRLRRIIAAHPGLRFPGSWSVFEVLVRAIAGQQVSVRAARTVLSRLVDELGEALDPGDEMNAMPNRLFPEAGVLATEPLQRFGLNTARAETINRVAARFAADARFVHAGMPFAAARKRLLAIKGVGPWTADYVLLRGLRYPDAFPAADLGAIRAAGVSKPRELEALAQAWRPWRGYALLYLWKSLESDT